MTSLLAGAKSDTHVGLRDLRHTLWHAQTYSRATALAAKRVKAHFFAFGMLWINWQWRLFDDRRVSFSVSQWCLCIYNGTNHPLLPWFRLIRRGTAKMTPFWWTASICHATANRGHFFGWLRSLMRSFVLLQRGTVGLPSAKDGV